MSFTVTTPPGRGINPAKGNQDVPLTFCLRASNGKEKGEFVSGSLPGGTKGLKVYRRKRLSDHSRLRKTIRILERFDLSVLVRITKIWRDKLEVSNVRSFTPEESFLLFGNFSHCGLCLRRRDLPTLRTLSRYQ